MKVMKMVPNEKLVDFSKSESNRNEFHQDQPVSDFLRKQMEEVHRDFTRYMFEQHYNAIQSIMKEFIDDLHPREEKRKPLENNLFWWKILYESSQDEWSCSDGYLEENDHRFMDKDVIISWLKEWDKAETKFYYVGYKNSDRDFYVIDLLEDKMLNVILNDPETVSPKSSEIVVATLIPFGEGLYSPITDFYRFDYKAREVIGATFKFYYDKYLKTNSFSAAFVHVLSIMLQIERRIHLKMLRVK